MENGKFKHLGIEINQELYYKFRYIAKYEGRSMRRQNLYLIIKCIREFEESGGEIVLPDDIKNKDGASKK